MKEAGFGSKVPKARELSVKLLVGMNRNSHGFAFRTFTPYLIKLLEDADANVREASKDAVVELFT